MDPVLLRDLLEQNQRILRALSSAATASESSIPHRLDSDSLVVPFYERQISVQRWTITDDDVRNAIEREMEDWIMEARELKKLIKRNPPANCVREHTEYRKLLPKLRAGLSEEARRRDSELMYSQKRLGDALSLILRIYEAMMTERTIASRIINDPSKAKEKIDDNAEETLEEVYQALQYETTRVARDTILMVQHSIGSTWWQRSKLAHVAAGAPYRESPHALTLLPPDEEEKLVKVMKKTRKNGGSGGRSRRRRGNRGQGGKGNRNQPPTNPFEGSAASGARNN